MKEKQIGSGIGAGGISILAIFVVLCLATLAALSLVSRQSGPESRGEKRSGLRGILSGGCQGGGNSA